MQFIAFGLQPRIFLTHKIGRKYQYEDFDINAQMGKDR